MILETAQLKIKPGMEAEFEHNFAKILPLYEQAKGWLGASLRRSIEEPNSYLLLVEWETMEDHTVGFRNSDAFQEFRQLVGHCFDGQSVVGHSTLVAKSA